MNWNIQNIITLILLIGVLILGEYLLLNIEQPTNCYKDYRNESLLSMLSRVPTAGTGYYYTPCINSISECNSLLSTNCKLDEECLESRAPEHIKVFLSYCGDFQGGHMLIILRVGFAAIMISLIAMFLGTSPLDNETKHL